jgi:hypothetical protein
VPPPNLSEGYKELTFLDPHAAGNGFKGTQYSVSNNLQGTIARHLIAAYQAKANDPAPVVQANVDDAQVFFQRTPITAAHGSNGGVYNLWSQVPVAAASGVPVHYANLTGSGISHAGNFGVFDWYQANIVPSLGNGPAFFDPSALSATRTISASQPSAATTFSGTSAPGASIDVYAQSSGSTRHLPLGQTIADASGHWSVVAVRSPNSPNTRYFAHAKVIAAPDLNRVYVTSTAQATTSKTP